MTKIPLVCVLVILFGVADQNAYADQDDVQELEGAIAQLQNPTTAGDLWDAVGKFTYNDFTKLPPAEQKKASDLIFNIMDGTQPIPEGRIPAADVRETAVRAVSYALYSANEKGLPSPIPNVSDRLIKAASKSPDIAGEAFEAVLGNTNIGQGKDALKSPQYKELVNVAKSNPDENVRAAAVSTLAIFTEGGTPTEKFVLSRLSGDSSPKVKASALGGLLEVWRMDGVAEPDQKSVRRILADPSLQKTLIDGFDQSKKYDSMKDDSSHPILCTTIQNYVTFAEIGDAVNSDTINDRNVVQPTMGLLQSAVGKLESTYPSPTEINCSSRNMFGQSETRVYDTRKLDKAMNGILADLRDGPSPPPIWTVSCKDFVSVDQGASSCEGPVKTALANAEVGCADVQVQCTSAPDAYCQVKSSNCTRAAKLCPTGQVRNVVTDVQICLAVPGAGNQAGSSGGVH